jgi:murein DD-endopeptidase MepM/ murein hydrolase activator NlpD
MFEIARVNAMVGDSLYDSAIALGATDKEVTELADACGYDLDFQRDVRPTDRFEIVFERIFDEEGRTVRTGKTLFVSIDTRLGTRLFFAFRAPGAVLPSWYDSIGQSARRFLRMTPINGARVSSTFGMRNHPILGYSRLHRGVDFAAPIGTPVQAAGDGVITRAGWNGGYGDYVRVRHANGYETAYAHLSAFAGYLRPGSPVLQGQIIGYVGTTGLSTGPHLHYEVLYRGSQINPMNLRVASGRYLTNRDLQLFRAEVERIDTLRANLWRGLTRVPLASLTGSSPNIPVSATGESIHPQ